LGGAVPTANDDVIINALGGASVSISQPATSRSVTIAGGQYPQTLTILSSLAVGAGGISVLSGGTLQVQSNNNLPLSVIGNATVSPGGSLVFQSGAITGPGVYNVNPGATLTFSQSALKLITGTTLNLWSNGTVQASTIEIEKNGIFNNYGTLNVIGAVNVFSTDNTGVYNNYGAFNYQGGSPSVVLNLQLNTNFYSTLNIVSGSVSLSYNFRSNSTIDLPAGSTLTVAAGQSVKNFNVIKGTGQLVVAGVANVNAPISLSSLIITDSGDITFNAAASFGAAVIGGILNAQAGVALTNLTFVGGTLTGPGTTQVSRYLWLDPSDTGNSNNFLSSTLILYGTGQSTSSIYFLLGNGGQFHIAQGASYNILGTFTFGVQAGKPLVIVDGTLSASLGPTQSITTNVDISGSGTIKINSGNFVANGDTITTGTLNLATATVAVLNTVTLTAGTISGAGTLNLTAAPTPISSITTVALTNLNVINGQVNIGSFAVTVFSFWTGAVTLAAGSANTATIVNQYGGSLTGAAKLTATSYNMDLTLPAQLNGVAIKTNSFVLSGSGSLQYSNGATIVSSGSTASSHISRGGVVIN
jgi:fibronectin-binding autotransporter adhesin